MPVSVEYFLCPVKESLIVVNDENHGGGHLTKQWASGSSKFDRVYADGSPFFFPLLVQNCWGGGLSRTRNEFKAKRIAPRELAKML